MGASNFAIGNASKVYAVLMDIEETFLECSECGQKHYDWEYNLNKLRSCSSCKSTEFNEIYTEYRAVEDYEVDEFKYYVRETAENLKTKFSYNFEDEIGHERNYNTHKLFSFFTSKSFGDKEVEIKIVGKLVGAYYEGASLDFEVMIYNGVEWCELSNGYYKITESDILHDFFNVGYEDYYSEMNQGMRKIQFKNATKWAEKTIQQMILETESIFEQVSTPYNVLGMFSNGETIYSKAS